MPRKHSDNKAEVRKQLRAILPRLRGKRSSTRIEAIRELGSLGNNAATASACLLPFIEDPDDTIRSAAMWALVEIGKQDRTIYKTVRELLEISTDPYTKCRIYWILEYIE